MDQENRTVTVKFGKVLKSRPKYTGQQLEEAFDKVKNPRGWKLPVCAHLSPEDVDEALITEAVIHYTGSIPSFRLMESGKWKGKVRVKAAGYYMAIGM